MQSCLVVSDSLQSHKLGLARLLCPWNYPGKNTGVGSHSLLQGIFATQGLNPGLLRCRWILYCLHHQGSPPSHLPFNKCLSAIHVLKIKQGTKNDGVCHKGADSIEKEKDMMHPLRSTLGVASSRKPS